MERGIVDMRVSASSLFDGLKSAPDRRLRNLTATTEQLHAVNIGER